MIRVLFAGNEQKPWMLNPDEFEMFKQPLRTGDYTIAGLEGQFTCERKSLGDFVSTVIHDWIRFRKQLIRMSGFDTALIVVEADLADVFAHRYESEAAPDSVIGRANAIYLDHGIQVAWWGSRIGGCVHMVENLFTMVAKKMGVTTCDQERSREFQPFPSAPAFSQPAPAPSASPRGSSRSTRPAAVAG